MEYPHTYFEDEIREGFFISGKMKRAWAAQLEVLMEIDKVCKKHKIKWFIDCGTLLGAVRHGGYIPWDDDMDICMLREDYTKFTAIAEKELPEGYVLLNMHKEEEDFAEYISRVTNSHRIRFDEDFLNKYHDSPYCIGIDIFPIDYVCPDEEEEALRKELCKMVMHAAESKASDEDDKEALKDKLEELETLCKVKFDYDKPIRKQLYELVEALFSMYSADEATEVALMPYWTAHDHHKYKKEYFQETVMLPFEGYMLPAPAAYDAVLKIEYYNYMNVVSAGGVHDYPFYNKQECYLKDFLPSYPFTYKFDPKHLEKNRMAVKASKNMGKDFVNIIREAHNALCTTLSTNQIELLNQILSSCQDSAIKFGTMIEEDYYVGHPTVSILEEYCELIYEISQIAIDGMLNDESINIINDTLKEIENKLCVSIENHIMNRKEILFMPFRACYWDTMESTWENAIKEDNCDVYVMPIPYYDRSVTGQFRDMFYEGDEFPEYVNIIDYREYDIAKRHPDIIYFQNPFDECNFTTSVAPEYYSRFLKKYTEQLVYIPFFVMDDIKRENGKAWFTMEYFCTVPGLMHADKVILQSEEMRNAYIERLTEFAGEDTREIWENKISGDGVSRDYILERKRRITREKCVDSIPHKIRERSIFDDNKKIVFFSVNISSLTQYGEKLFDKIDYSMKLFEKKRDELFVILHIDQYITKKMKNAPSSISKRYFELVDRYSNFDWCSLDESDKCEDYVYLCDAYYGDKNSIARMFNYEKKPVLFMNSET